MFDLSKISIFRRKKNNYIEKRRGRGGIFGESHFPFCVSQKPTQLDPEFSIDGFLSKLQNFQEAIIFDKPILPPKPKINKNNVLSTKCYVEIFKRVPAEELLNFRLVCKDFDTIIQNHALELPKISSHRVILSQNDCGNFICMKENGSPSDDLLLEEIDRPLRHLTTESLTLENITLNSKVMRYFHRSFKYSINELKFEECCFALTPDKLARLISPWKPKSLEFNNCKWLILVDSNPSSFDQLFIDYFFSNQQELDSLVIDFSKFSQQRLRFTDKISRIFDEPLKLPSTLILKNCISNISCKTLHASIWAYIESVNNSLPSTTTSLPKSFNWSFGRIADSRDTILLTLSRFADFILSQHISNSRVDVTFQAQTLYPPLHFSVEFDPPQEAYDCREEDESEIEWDESINESENFFSTSETFVTKS